MIEPEVLVSIQKLKAEEKMRADKIRFQQRNKANRIDKIGRLISQTLFHLYKR